MIICLSKSQLNLQVTSDYWVAFTCMIRSKRVEFLAAMFITELPYQVNKATWIEKLADLVNNGKMEGIADIRDESDREGMRIVIEMRRDANSEKIKKLLYQKTNNIEHLLI